MSIMGVTALVFDFLYIHRDFFSHEELRPVATKILKEYQYERFDPDTYHHQAAKTAICSRRIYW